MMPCAPSYQHRDALPPLTFRVEPICQYAKISVHPLGSCGSLGIRQLTMEDQPLLVILSRHLVHDSPPGICPWSKTATYTDGSSEVGP